MQKFKISISRGELNHPHFATVSGTDEKDEVIQFYLDNDLTLRNGQLLTCDDVYINKCREKVRKFIDGGY